MRLFMVCRISKNTPLQLSFSPVSDFIEKSTSHHFPTLFLPFFSRSNSINFSTSPFCKPGLINTSSRIRKESTSTQQESSSSSSSTKQPTTIAPATARVSAIVDQISGLTLLEVAHLTEILREKLNVSEMPIMAVMTPGMGIGGIRLAGKGTGAKGGEEEKKKEEKTAFDLKLESFEAASKIKIIKEVRTFTDLGLKEAKELVEKAPALLKKGVSKEEAEKIVEKMKELGAKVVME
eukprot:TRINITY_DN7979_c0_g1_i1.p1 TRINITY_DN7979_c0_g1~~TRINITY_DN7979_c0_g1_i1.p1  ORF type:complete len:236 (+),score=57.65 TRINITY_DN7979_c0_g1_i1:158-865(+)